MNIDLSGRVALVTGATGELGRVISRTLAQCGADVAVHYHKNSDQAEELCREIASMTVRACRVQADITSREEVMQMRDLVNAELGAPSIIVSKAVIQYSWRPVLEQAQEDYESQFRSCVLQNVLMTQEFVPAMIACGSGRVIGINTECAMQNFPTQSAYVAGKRGMDGVLRVLAKEIGPHNITVNQIAPGWMISDKQRGTPEEEQLKYSRSVPQRRRGHDQKIANTTAFLASDLAEFITGAYIPVCGGNVMPAI